MKLYSLVTPYRMRCKPVRRPAKHAYLLQSWALKANIRASFRRLFHRRLPWCVVWCLEGQQRRLKRQRHGFCKNCIACRFLCHLSRCGKAHCGRGHHGINAHRTGPPYKAGGRDKAGRTDSGGKTGRWKIENATSDKRRATRAITWTDQAGPKCHR